MWSARQGDVYLEEVSSIPDEVTEVARDNGRIVLAYGEATGHSHSISAKSAKLLETNSGERFLRIMRGATLEHQEHDAIKIPVRYVRVGRQREYSPEAIRNVAD